MVAEHARSLIFVDYGEVPSPGVLAKVFYFITGFGHEAVMVFFVISGYLVGGKVWSLYREGRFGWRRYLADRASRLYAVLFVALLLGAAMDWTGYLFFNKYGLYNQGYEGSIAVLGAAPIDRMGWQDFLVNAFFLQTIVGPTFGSNGPLWSLAYEWWYYVLFPLALAAVWPIADYGWRKTEEKAEKLKLGKAESGDFLDAGLSTLDASPRRRFLIGAGSLLAAAGLCWFLTWEILIFFGVWLLGVATAALQPRTDPSGIKMHDSTGQDSAGLIADAGAAERLIADSGPEEYASHSTDERGLIAENLPATSYSLPATAPASLALDAGRWTLDFSSRAARVLSALFFGAVLLVARAEVLKVPYGWQYLLGLTFALVLVSLARGTSRWVFSKPSAYLADFSYSVYLIHFPVLMLVISVAYSLTGYGIKISFGAGGLIWFAIVFASAILIAWLVSRFTEQKTSLLRAKFYTILQVQHSQNTVPILKGV